MAPILKWKDTVILNYFRPISVFPLPGKMLEHLTA